MRIRCAAAVRTPRTPSARHRSDEVSELAVRGPLAPMRVLELQRSIGNEAVCALLGRDRQPNSAAQPTVMRQPAAAAECVTQDAAPPPARELPAYDESLMAGSEPVRAVMCYIRYRDQGGQGTLGVTIWPPITEYTVPGVRFIPTQGADGRWSAQVTRAWLPGKPHIEAFSPSQGLHQLTDTYLYFGQKAADRVDEGEREHVRDILYSWAAVTSILDGAIAKLMALRPPTAPTQDEAVRCAQAWLRQALPPKLRWPLSTGVSMGMIQAMTKLGTTTWNRDTSWHKLPAHTLTATEKQDLKLPVGVHIREVADEGHEIGSHSTADLIKAKWATLPALE